ncbi:MAG: metallophosphoesterase [Defluviitaleaceae bacterium]|nr:metallophosphoesterase [Defluviitaleaceae bacterium]
MDTKKAALMGLSMAAAAVPVMGYALSLPFRIRYETAAFQNLPSHLRGLKILHIADLHGRHPKKMHRDIWPDVLSLDFDMAVLTGDVVLDAVSQIYPHLDGLKALVKRVPVFYVDGNHEDGCYREMAQLFESIGINVLYNRRSRFAVGRLDKGKSSVVSVAGFRDYYHLKKQRFREAIPLLDDITSSGDFHIVLSHQPQIFDLLCKRAAKTNASPSALVLAGHTHGGQLRLPLFPTLYAPGQGILPRYGDGWYHSKRLKLFVSRGIGGTQFPIRLFNPPEVAVIQLQKD